MHGKNERCLMHVSITMKPVAVMEAEATELNKVNGPRAHCTVTKQPEATACIYIYEVTLPKLTFSKRKKYIHVKKKEGQKTITKLRHDFFQGLFFHRHLLLMMLREIEWRKLDSYKKLNLLKRGKTSSCKLCL